MDLSFYSQKIFGIFQFTEFCWRGFEVFSATGMWFSDKSHFYESYITNQEVI